MPVVARVAMKVGKVGAMALSQVVDPHIKEARARSFGRANRS
jgi:hypothetical protein